jgi:YVTN family beta-propeller protein
MTNFTHKFSKLVLGATIQVIAVALFLVVFGVSAVFAQTRAYVTNALDNTVSVIDIATNTVPLSIRSPPLSTVARSLRVRGKH